MNSSTRRRSITPTGDEMREAAHLVTVDATGVRALRRIDPFTRVAVCFGRVFSKKEHVAVFGKTDPWEQWTFQRDAKGVTRHGFVVTPGLPGGAIDPLFADMGAFPFFQDSGPASEPECVYVWNYPKGRMEYWVGRHGADRGTRLRVCYVHDASRFPVLYLMYGHLSRPVSVHELAAQAKRPEIRRILAKVGGWHAPRDVPALASKYNPALEYVLLKTSNNASNALNRYGNMESNNIDPWEYVHHQSRVLNDMHWSGLDGGASLAVQRATDRIKHAYIKHALRGLCKKNVPTNANTRRAMQLLAHMFAMRRVSNFPDPRKMHAFHPAHLAHMLTLLNWNKRGNFPVLEEFENTKRHYATIPWNDPNLWNDSDPNSNSDNQHSTPMIAHTASLVALEELCPRLFPRSSPGATGRTRGRRH